MRQNTLKALAMAGLLSFASVGTAQVSLLTNNIIGIGPYVGCDASSTQPLRFSTLANYPQEWRTNNVLRMRLLPTLTGQTIGSHTNENLSGNVGIGAFTSGNVDRPFSLLHLDNGGSQFSGYRPWFRPGMTITNGSDLGWIGLKNEGGGLNHLTLAWADNAETQAPDLFKLIFLANNNAANGTAGTLDGLEAARIRPAAGGNESFFGIGDWFTTGGNTNPTERLHLLDGRLRIEQLPTDPIASTLTKFLVVDDTPGADFGVVKWRNVPPGTGGGCEWSLLGAPGSNSNVATAYNGNPGCPQGDKRVGIGTNFPAGKLAVLSKVLSEGGAPVGVNVELKGGTGSATGVNVVVQPESGATDYQYGIQSTVTNGTKANISLLATARITSVANTAGNTAVFGQATVGGSGSTTVNSAGNFIATQTGNATVNMNIGSENIANGGANARGIIAQANATSSTSLACGVDATATSGTALNYGVRAIANTAASGTGTNYGVDAAGTNGSTNYGIRAQGNGPAGSTNYGIRAQAIGPAGSTNWAGYFEGNVNSTGIGYYVNGVFVASDAQFKTNVQPLEDPMAIIMQLQPHRYDFLTDQYPQMNFPAGGQVGLVAQELEAVIPALVSDTHVASVTDSMGVEVTPAVDYKAVNYAGLVPYLIGAVQQQQATIAQMQDQIAQCCAAQNPGMAPIGNGTVKSAPATENVQEQRLLIQPNPFTDHTTLSYYVPQAGKVSLAVSTSDGKPLGTLREEQAEAGAYTYEWNTGKLASGTYFCTLMVDGNVVVKRAVKVVR